MIRNSRILPGSRNPRVEVLHVDPASLDFAFDSIDDMEPQIVSLPYIDIQVRCSSSAASTGHADLLAYSRMP